jgi:hypothetical protein
VSFKSLFAIVGVALGGAVAINEPAEAATISLGSQLDIVGVVDVQNSSFQPGGSLVFDGDGIVNIATGDFAPLLGSTADMFDLNFAPPEDVYSVGGFTFTANSYFDFDDASSGRAFAARGLLSHADFDDTPGILALTTQSVSGGQILASFSSSTMVIPVPASVLMLLAGLAGLAIVSRGGAAARA